MAAPSASLLLASSASVQMPIDIPQDQSLPVGDVSAPPSDRRSSGPGAGGGIGTGVGTGLGPGTGPGVGPGSGSQFWVINGDPALPNGDKKFSNKSSDANFWFKTTNADGSKVFTKPAAGTISTQDARGIAYGPGFQNHNIGLFKQFRVSESQSLWFRFEAFNWLNHPNWGTTTVTDTLDINPNSATFGKVTSKNSERTVQFALRYAF